MIAIYVIIMLLIFSLDRITKIFALTYWRKEYVVNSYLYFQLMFNRGVSWGFFNYCNTVIFLLVSTIIIAVTAVLAYYAYIRLKDKFLIIGEILVISGSISNIVDRVYYGGVIDFIAFHYGSCSWPIFNIADAAIVIGVIFMFFQLFFKDVKSIKSG